MLSNSTKSLMGTILLVFALLLTACQSSTKQTRAEAQPTDTPATEVKPAEAEYIPITAPIATSWMYLCDDTTYQYDSVPAFWANIDFTKVNVLNIGPLGVQDNQGTFGLYAGNGVDLSNRFNWVIAQARKQNPNIKIFVSQWWGYDSDYHKWGQALFSVPVNQYEHYANSLIDFILSYQDVSGGIDGYDIDYEDNNVGDFIPPIAQLIRTKMDSLATVNQRPYYFSVSPATMGYLSEITAQVNFINMQNYAGGYGNITAEALENMGYSSKQILTSVCPESNCGTSFSVAQALGLYKEDSLAGIHVWRLNSDNYVYEGEVMAEVYDGLHP